MIWVIIIAAPLLIWALSRGFVSKKQNAFVRLGDVRGKTLAEITAVVGPPSSQSATPTGTLCQWIKATSGGGYHYAITFDADGRAAGYSHQHVS